MSSFILTTQNFQPLNEQIKIFFLVSVKCEICRNWGNILIFRGSHAQQKISVPARLQKDAKVLNDT